MSAEKVFAKGIMCFDKHASAPDFVIGTVVITPRELVEWIKENPNYLTDYKGAKQLKFQILKGSKGPYMVVDTYVKGEAQKSPEPMSMQNDFQQPKSSPSSDLPF
jgi:hypothetical protein